jgi:transcriptional regulator with XRE-family HTH domain
MSAQQNSGDKQNQARNLYFQTTLTQAQKAELIGVSQRTVSNYINDNKWNLLKQRAEQAPALMLEQMHSELQELNEAIASRPFGQRFPSKEEAEIRRKTLISINLINARMSAGYYSQVFMNFINWVYKQSIEDAQFITRYADKFLKGQMKSDESPRYANYELPSSPAMPTPPSPGSNAAPGTGSSGQDNNHSEPDDLNKAA